MLVLSFGALMSQSDGVHVFLMVAHGLLAAWYAWKLKTTQPLTAIFLLGYAPMYFVNPIAICMGWIEPDSPEHALYFSNFLMMIGLDLFIIGAYRLRFVKGDLNKLPPIELSEGRVDIAIIISLFVYLIVSCIQILGVGSVDSSRDIFDLQKTDVAAGGEFGPYYLLARYASFSLPFAGFLIALKRPSKQIIYLAPLFALLFLQFLLFRVRQGPIAVTQGYLLGILSRYVFVTLKGFPLRGEIPKHVRVGLLVMIPMLAVMAVSIRWVRGMYATGNYNFSAESGGEFAGSVFQSGDFAVAYMTRKAVEKFPSEHPYLDGLSVYRLFLTPIPRAIWPEKPDTPQRIFAGVLNPRYREKGVTIPAGVVGDLYINFGPWGVLGMVVIGFVFAQEHYKTLGGLLMLATSGTWIFHFTRGSQTGPIVVFAATWIAAKILQFLLAPSPYVAAHQAWQYAWAWRPAVAMPGVAPKLKPRGG